MASSTRNHTIKRDVAKGTILSRIATNGLVIERYDALFYEILKGLNIDTLPTHKQMAGILFAACCTNIICVTDCRSVVTEPDFQEKLVRAQGLDALYAQFYKLFDKLNAIQGRDKSREEETSTSIGETLQGLLSQHLNDS